MRNIRSLLAALMIGCLLAIVGCSSSSQLLYSFDTDSIKLMLVEQQEEATGIYYEFEVANESEHEVGYLHLYLQYSVKETITHEDGSVSSRSSSLPYKLEANAEGTRPRPIKLNPRETVRYTAFAPTDMFGDEASIDFTDPMYELDGVVLFFDSTEVPFNIMAPVILN